MHPSFRPRSVAGVLFFVAAAVVPQAYAQIQPFVRYEGKLLPMVGFDGFVGRVIHDGKRERASDDIELKPGTAFLPGVTAEITKVRTDLDPTRNLPSEKRTAPSLIRFRYEAEVSSTQPVKDAYGMLTYVANGSVGTSFVHIGSLSAGKSRDVKIELRHRVESVGKLHLFGGGNGVELVSNQVTGPYQAKTYFDQLVQGSRGVAAAALCKAEDTFPHQLSDDGSLLATIRDRDTHKSLIIFDLKSESLRHDIKLGDLGETAWDLTWISDHELAYVTMENKGDYHTYLMLLDTTTGKTERLAQDIQNIFSSPKKDRSTLVVFGWRWQHHTGTAKYDVRNRRLGPVQSLEVGTTRFDDNGSERLRDEYDGPRIRFHYKASSNSRWELLDKHVEEPGLRFDLDSRNVLDRVCQIHSIGPDGDTLYISTRLHSDRFEIAAYSLAEGKIRKIVASNPKYDLAKGNEGSTRLLFRKGSSELIGLIYEGEKPQVVWLDPNYAAMQKIIDESLPDHINTPLDWSVDGNTLIYYSFNDRDPGTYYVFRPKERQLLGLLAMGDALKGETLARTTTFDFTARDGATVHAYVTRPPGAKPGEALPVVVYIHGGPAARDTWGFNATNQFLATRGYLVLQVNYRGSSGYGAAYQKAGLYARFDTVVLDDIADGVHALIKNSEADARRIAVIGGSFGGWATYMSLIKYPELYRSGVAIAAVSHWKSLVQDTKQIWNGGDYGAAYWKSLLEHSDFEKSEAFIDPYLRVAELKQPIYIMHGEGDTTVRPTEARLMLNALKKQNAPVESMSFPRASHTEWPYESRVMMLNEIDGFLRRTIPPEETKVVQK
ncbi:MAG TPA: alpha/beta fold hydrolase [Lacunisphaera sp.]